MRKKRIARPDEDLLHTLIRHLSLLEDFAQRAFGEGDDRYYGEIAGKLRVLVVRTRTNKPLLLDLMVKYESTVKVTLDRPVGPKAVSLEDYLAEVCFMQHTPSGERAIFTRSKFIASWAQQFGASHEDWEHTEDFAVARNPGVTVGDQPLPVHYLRGFCRTVIAVGARFCEELVGRGVLKTRANEGSAPKDVGEQ